MDNLKELIPFLVIVGFSILSKLFESQKKDKSKPAPASKNPAPVQRQSSPGPRSAQPQQKAKPADKPVIRGNTQQAPPVADIPDPLRKLLNKLGAAPKAVEQAQVPVARQAPEPRKTVAVQEPVMPAPTPQHGEFEFNGQQVRQAILWQALLGKPRSKAPWQAGQSLI